MDGVRDAKRITVNGYSHYSKGGIHSAIMWFGGVETISIGNARSVKKQNQFLVKM